MANSKGPSSVRNVMYNGKNPLLPPKSPFPSISPSYIEYVPTVTQKGVSKPRELNSHHMRTSSESFLMEEQPSWLDDLLNEPDTPVRRGGHRRSSSDSFAYLDAANVSNMDYVVQDDGKFRNVVPNPSWGAQEFDLHRDARHAAFYADSFASSRHKNRAASPNKTAHPRGIPSPRENVVVQHLGTPCPLQEADRAPSPTIEKQDQVESGPFDSKSSAEKKDSPHAKNSSLETDTKRAKQQFAQRSRVRKLQYIAELERNVQALQAEGSEVSAELEFLNQQNLILNMENKALKQRLESLAQEQLIKYFEHEVLERERGRLRALYQQQKTQQPPSSGHRRTKSRDLDQQFANLSLKNKEAGSDHEPISGLSGQLQI